MEVPKGKNHQFSLGTTQLEGTQCRFPHPRQNNLRRAFPERAQEDGARVKRNVRNFNRGTAVRKRPRGVRITRRLSEKVAKRVGARTIRAGEYGRYCYVQIRPEKTWKIGGRSNVQFYERDVSIRQVSDFADFPNALQVQGFRADYGFCDETKPWNIP